MTAFEPEIIDFEIIKEPWNIYKSKDGSTLKIRFVLIKVIKEGIDETGNPIYGINSSNVVGVIAPKNLKGTPSPPYTPKELASSIVEDDIAFDTVSEDWNVYKLKDGVTLNIKLVLVKVSRTNKFDSRGDPIYLVNSQPIVKPTLLKKSSSIKREHPTFVT